MEESLIEPHVDLRSPCILSSYATSPEGYARVKRIGRNWLHHRWVYWQRTAKDPEVVLQLCDNRRCVSIAHLSACSSVADVPATREAARRIRREHAGH